MFERLIALFKEPQKYLPLIPKKIQQKFCFLFRNTAFFMQGQMDINPKSLWNNPDFVKLTGGFFIQGDKTERQILNLEPWDNTRRDMIILLLRSILENNIQGDIAEVGVYKGNTAKLIHYYMPERRLHLFDTFEGFNKKDLSLDNQKTGLSVKGKHFNDTSFEQVKKNIASKNDNVMFYKGYFPKSVPESLFNSRFAFVNLDADLYEPTLKGLEFFFPRMNNNGYILVHDYNAWAGARKAVDDFFAKKPEIIIPMPDKCGSALIVKYALPV
jgi:O-methyltransferase